MPRLQQDGGFAARSRWGDDVFQSFATIFRSGFDRFDECHAVPAGARFTSWVSCKLEMKGPLCTLLLFLPRVEEQLHRVVTILLFQG